jgi:hypothetical protein
MPRKMKRKYSYSELQNTLDSAKETLPMYEALLADHTKDLVNAKTKIEIMWAYTIVENDKLQLERLHLLIQMCERRLLEEYQKQEEDSVDQYREFV